MSYRWHEALMERPRATSTKARGVAAAGGGDDAAPLAAGDETWIMMASDALEETRQHRAITRPQRETRLGACGKWRPGVKKREKPAKVGVSVRTIAPLYGNCMCLLSAAGEVLAACHTRARYTRAPGGGQCTRPR